jgi:hypothetical protein
VHGPAGGGPCDVFFVFSSPCLALYYWIIVLYLRITKASSRLTPYHLKDKKGVRRLETPYRLKNYDQSKYEYAKVLCFLKTC